VRLDRIALARECFIHSLEWINPAKAGTRPTQVATVSTKANVVPTQVDVAPAKVDALTTQVVGVSAQVDVDPAKAVTVSAGATADPVRVKIFRRGWSPHRTLQVLYRFETDAAPCTT